MLRWPRKTQPPGCLLGAGEQWPGHKVVPWTGAPFSTSIQTAPLTPDTKPGIRVASRSFLPLSPSPHPAAPQSWAPRLQTPASDLPRNLSQRGRPEGGVALLGGLLPVHWRTQTPCWPYKTRRDHLTMAQATPWGLSKAQIQGFVPAQREVCDSSCQGHREGTERNPGGPSAESSGLQRFL